MGVEEVMCGFIAFTLIFIIPAIPGVLLWFFLQPITFWQKLAWFVISAIIYLFLARVIVEDVV
ncbi:MAG: hypothetical protein DRP00_04735 [Candidatus Aenigmatarchaeota archaeon]|nr:MAG: hypothetical protein DRP00_04735 [Candidatus Aenigmarchaeota archaeon]